MQGSSFLDLAAFTLSPTHPVINTSNPSLSSLFRIYICGSLPSVCLQHTILISGFPYRVVESDHLPVFPSMQTPILTGQALSSNTFYLKSFIGLETSAWDTEIPTKNAKRAREAGGLGVFICRVFVIMKRVYIEWLTPAIISWAQADSICLDISVIMEFTPRLIRICDSRLPCGEFWVSEMLQTHFLIPQHLKYQKAAHRRKHTHTCTQYTNLNSVIHSFVFLSIFTKNLICTQSCLYQVIQSTRLMPILGKVSFDQWDGNKNKTNAFSFFFLGLNLCHMEVTKIGVKLSCSCQPTPQPQQHQIWAVSVTYNTAHSNTRSLTHWSWPGIESTSSYIPVGVVTTEP